MQLKKAENKDKNDILDIISDMHIDMPGFVWNQADFVQKQIDNGEYFVAEVDGKTVGILSLRQRGPKMYIETLAVLPEYRRQKIGTKLVEFAKNTAKEKGLARVCACSFLEYKIGDFYLNQGFSLAEKPGNYNGHKYHIFISSV